jgi:arylsulfatase
MSKRLLSCVLVLLLAHAVQAQEKKPNILFIMGDDIGWFNPSCYNSGVMGYKTPNIDRIGAEGARFTDWYGQQSCTAVVGGVDDDGVVGDTQVIERRLG